MDSGWNALPLSWINMQASATENRSPFLDGGRAITQDVPTSETK